MVVIRCPIHFPKNVLGGSPSKTGREVGELLGPCFVVFEGPLYHIRRQGLTHFKGHLPNFRLI